MTTNPKKTSKFRGFQGPNYTMVPDELFDELMVDLSGAELKVLLYIIRRTFGFKREADAISLSQMLNGITKRDGQVLDRGVGISKPTLLQALRSLEDRNIIETERQRSIEKGDEPTIYKLNFIDGALQQEILPPLVKKVDHPPVNNVDQGGGEESSPRPWTRKLTTQETVKQETDLDLSNIRRVSQIEKSDNEPTRASTPSTIPSQVERAWPNASIPPRSISDHKRDSTHAIDEQTGGQDRRAALRRGVSRTSRGTQSTQSTRGSGFEGAGSVISRVHQLASPETDEDRQIILEYVEDFAREFNDQAPLKSSTTRAYHLYQQTGLPIGTFISRMQEARSITKESTAQIRAQATADGRGAPAKKKMAYFFSVLEDRLGLRPAEE